MTSLMHTGTGIRFEYQSRGSIHCYGLAKLKNDQDLCHLSEITL